MTDKQLQREVKELKKRSNFAFWGFWISITSIIQGWFIYHYSGYLMVHSEPYLRFIPEKLIGIVLIAFGVVKIAGVLSDNRILKSAGIWGLSSVWTALFVVAATFSFGTGYPDDRFIIHLFIMIACYRVSFRGDYR